MKKDKKKAFNAYRNKMVIIAKQLCYSKDIVKRIENCKSEAEIDHVVHDYRKGDEWA